MDDLTKVAAAVGDPLRARILDLLAAGRQQVCCSPHNPERPDGVCACDLAPALGGPAPSTLAYHLGRLRAVGLVEEQCRGKWVYYSINHAVLARFVAALESR